MEIITLKEENKILERELKRKKQIIQNLSDINYAQTLAFKDEIRKYKILSSVLLILLMLSSGLAMHILLFVKL